MPIERGVTPSDADSKIFLKCESKRVLEMASLGVTVSIDRALRVASRCAGGLHTHGVNGSFPGATACGGVESPCKTLSDFFGGGL